MKKTPKKRTKSSSGPHLMTVEFRRGQDIMTVEIEVVPRIGDLVTIRAAEAQLCGYVRLVEWNFGIKVPGFPRAFVFLSSESPFK
jgi:hypothetical protein